MPLWTRIALAVGLSTALAVAVASALGSFAARSVLAERVRAGAEGTAELLAEAASLAAAHPERLESEIGEQMALQARLLAQLVAVSADAGLSREEVEGRLRQIVGQSATELLATDAEGVVAYSSSPERSAYRFSADPTVQPQSHVFHRLLGGDVPSVIQEARAREEDDVVAKYVGVPGIDGARIVRVGGPADFLDRLERTAGVRRLFAGTGTALLREVRLVDARANPVFTRVVDARGNASESAIPLDQADAQLVRECITSGRTVGRSGKPTVRVAAPVRRGDGLASGAVVVAVDAMNDGRLLAREILTGLLSAAIAGVPAALAAAWLVRGVVGPVTRVSALLESLARGDLAGDPGSAPDPDLGRLVGAARSLKTALSETWDRVRLAGAGVAAGESALSTTLSRHERAVRGFSGAAVDLAGGLTQVAMSAEQLLAATAQAGAAAHEAARVADEGRGDFDGMSESMRQLDEAMNVFNRKLATIRQRAGGINAVVTTIAKVADQTNLLSVNATIEAEKAGEAGRGFRIVAQEIRRLADQTALATKDIERMVRDMQSAVSSGTMEMDRFRNEVSERIRRVTQVGEQLARIAAPVHSVTQALDGLRLGMEGQSSSIRQVRDGMERLRSGAGQSAATTESFNSTMDRFRGAIADLNEELARVRPERPAGPGGT